MEMVKRGDICLISLDPTVGSEIKKTRPCIIISPPEMHDFLNTMIVAPMTTGGRPAPFRVPISFSEKSGLIVLDQMRAVDKKRIVKKLGSAHPKTLNKVLLVLQEIFSD